MNFELPKPHILLIEDNEEDYTTFLHLVERSAVPCVIDRCTSGDDALDFLFRRGLYVSIQKRPSLIILDLNLPGTDGRSVLMTIKSDPNLKSIPVLILTTSSNSKDIAECYRLGANSYQLKAIDLPKLRQTIKHTLEYWLQIAVLSA